MNSTETSFLEELLRTEAVTEAEARQLTIASDQMSQDDTTPVWEIALQIGLVTRPQVENALHKIGMDVAGDEASAGDTRSLAPMRPSSNASTGGRMLGGFRLTSKLGQGGMGAVYKARQEAMDRDVAIKVLPRSLASNEEFTGRFLREARAAGRLSHPNIVAGIDAGFADGYYYFAMEYIEGRNLEDRVEQEGALDEAEVVRIGRQVALALDHAHAAGIFHRDVKPENILVDTSGHAKLCDLGLARSATENMRLTQAGVAIGTPFYISPEAIRGDPPDARSDVYSLGCTLYHLLTGQVPFDGDNSMQVMQKHLFADPAPITDIQPDVSNALVAVINRMMARDKSERYETAGDVAEELERIAQGGIPQALTAAMAERRTRAGRGTRGARGTRSTRAVKPVNRRTLPIAPIGDAEGEDEIDCYPPRDETRGLPVKLIITITGIVIIIAAAITAAIVIRQRKQAERARSGASARP